MKTPTVASLKKVNVENLSGLGAQRLAEILVDFAEARPDLKRRLRMELAAEQGADHLTTEVDKRLTSLGKSRSKVSWRQRATFIRDLDGLRGLIAERLAPLDRAAALDRMWLFMDLARSIGSRVRDKDGSLAAVFGQASSDLGALLKDQHGPRAAGALVEAVARNSSAWADWLPAVLEQTPGSFAQDVLHLLSNGQGTFPGWVLIVRQTADIAGDVDAFRSTYAPNLLRTPAAAAAVAQRLLAVQRTEEAGDLLRAAAPGDDRKDGSGRFGKIVIDFDWETAWIDYLELAGRVEAAQELRWASFERTLSIERARAFIRRLPEFEDVEAETRAFDLAAGHPDFERGLRFLMDWPALPDAGRMILARRDEVAAGAEFAEAWAARLRARQPEAAHLLLRTAAAAAFRRRDLATSERLTREADSIVA